MTTAAATAAQQWPAALSARPLLVADNHALEVRDAWLAAEVEHREMLTAGRTVPQDVARYQVIDNVAVIPVSGVLLNRYNFIGDGSPYTSYGALTREIRRATADTSIKGIILGVSSPGGAADGILAPSNAIRDARAQKPVTALVSGMAASGGYWLAAQASEIVLADDMAQVGSIGVYTMHMDVSRLLEELGITVSVIHSGRNKVDGHPFAPLPDSVRADIQQDVDDLRLMFAREVAAGRPVLTADLALATEAKMFTAFNPRTSARPALEGKLADRMGTLADVVGSITSGRSPGPSKRNAGMTDISKEDHERAVAAAREEGRIAAEASAKASADESAKQATARIAAIQTSEEAKGRESLANHIAFSTSMSAEDAKAMLAASPKAATTGSYEQRKAAAGAGGHVDVPNQVPVAKAGWDKATAAANRELGPGAIN